MNNEMKRHYTKDWCQGFCRTCGTGCAEYCEDLEEKCTEIADLKAKLAFALDTIQHYTCAGCQPEARGVFCYQYRSCKDLAQIRKGDDK